MTAVVLVYDNEKLSDRNESRILQGDCFVFKKDEI